MILAAPIVAQLMQLIHVQRRSISSLISLLIVPALLLCLLFLLQTLVMSVLNSPDYKCGCDPNNSSNCGLLQSTPTQAAFCSISAPPTWPVIAQVPPSLQASLLFHGEDETLSQSLSKDMLNRGESSLTLSLLQAWNDMGLALTFPSSSTFAGFDFCNNTLSFDNLLSSINDTALMQGVTNLTRLLSLSQIDLGTASVTSPSLLIEPAFMPRMPLFGSRAEGSSTSLFSGASEQNERTRNSSLYYLTTNCSLLSIADQRTLSQMSCALSSALNVTIECQSVNPQSVASRKEINRELYCSWPGSNGCPSSDRVQYPSLIFDWGSTSVDSSFLDLTVLVNDSNLGLLYTPPDVQRWNLPLNLAFRAFHQASMSQQGPPSGLLASSLILEGIKSFPVGQSSLVVDLTYILGGLFFVWIFLLPLPTFVHALSSSRQHIELQRIQGMRLADRWISCYLIFLSIYTIFVSIFILVGVGIRLSFFTNTSPLILFLTSIIWGHTLISLSFWLDIFLGFLDSSSLVLLSVCGVIFSGLASNLIVLSFIENGPEWAAIVLQLIPPFALYRCLYEISAYALRADTVGGPGLTLQSIHDEGNGMIVAWIILSLEAVCMALCAGYIKELFRGEGWGISRHPLFFLGLELKAQAERQTEADLEEASGVQEALDVGVERTKVNSLLPVIGVLERPPALLISSLRKVYPNGKVAVSCLDLCIGADGHESFGLLGPNGSGKTSTLSMIQGLIKPSSGSVFLSGRSMAIDQAGAAMDLGICPQHDVLFDCLTPREHLWLFGRIKKRSKDELTLEIEALMTGIGLSKSHSNLPSSKLSGGMRRRLSVSLALVGAPKLCILDEPSTGLDPENRRLMWACIQKARQSTSIILTTHSMTEAEELCDRIGIFVNGRLRAIGRVDELRSRYQSSLLLTISCPEVEDGFRVKDMIESCVCLGAKSMQEASGQSKTMRFELPRSSCSIRTAMRSMIEIKRRDGMERLRWEVKEASLESIFLEIVRSAERE